MPTVADKNRNGSLGIKLLVSNLEHLKKDPHRLNREKIHKIIHQAVNEIPYASTIIPVTLADNLLADAPQKQDDLTLNEVVVNFIKAVFNPLQKDDLINLLQIYFHERKKTEKEYALDILKIIPFEKELHTFPERQWTILKDLALSIIEKIISEKELRKASDYAPHSLFEIIQPIIYHRLYHIELERIRATQQSAFRKFVNSIAKEGYEKIIDNEKLLQVLKEKEIAFNSFKNAIINKVPNDVDFQRFLDIFIFLQKDTIYKNLMLQKQLDTFLKSKLNFSEQLRNRFNKKLHNNLHHVDLDILLYDSDQTIKNTHDEIAKEIQYEASAIKNLISTVDKIKKNHKKRTLYLPFANKIWQEIENSLTDALLGKIVMKPDPITLEKRAIRENGYPQQNLVEIYMNMCQSLNVISNHVSGIFSQSLKKDILSVIHQLKQVSKKLTITPQKIMAEPEPFIPVSEIEEEKVEAPPQEIALEKEEPQPPSVEEVTPIPEKIEPKPLEIEFEEEEPIVLAPTEIKEEEPIVSAPVETKEEEPIVLAPVETKEAETYDETTQGSLDAGIIIMKNYQLGPFEIPVKDAWKKMVIASSTPNMDMEAEGLVLPSDNEVRLYVICDLMQQVASIDETHLGEEQKKAYQTIKNQLLEALKNPVLDENWNYFEGFQRDIIDATLGNLI